MENKLNVRRMVGAILLLLVALGSLAYSQSILSIAWVGIVRQFQQFLYFYAAWGIGVAIWYLVTLKRPPVKKAEMIVKVIFYLVIGLNALYALALDFSNATAIGVALLVAYSIGCPWGKAGYSKHPYQVANDQNSQTQNAPQTQTPTEVEWYKKWYIWVIMILSVIIVSGGFFIVTDGSMHNNATTHQSPTASTSNSHTLEVGYDNYKIESMKTYRINYTDDSWEGGNVRINKVIVYKTAKPYKYDSANDGKFKINGFVKIYMTVKATSDVSIYPSQGTLNYSNGEQHDADNGETWDGDINSGSTKSGTITVPVEHLSSPGSLKSIRFKFTANSQDTDDDSLDKDFDFDINLK